MSNSHLLTYNIFDIYVIQRVGSTLFAIGPPSARACIEFAQERNAQVCVPFLMLLFASPAARCLVQEVEIM